MIRKIKIGGITQRAIALIIGIAILVYTVYHVVSLFGEDITTIATGISTQTQIIDAKGYVFRNEAVLYSENTGVADYLKPDGAKVSVGENLAVVREKGSGADKKLLRYYDNRIAILRESVGMGDTLADLPEISGGINDSYRSLCQMLASGDVAELASASDKLLLDMNRYDLLTNESSVVDDTLNSLVSKREALLKAGGAQSVESASDGGYFYSYVDGYESSFTLSAADGLAPESFNSLVTESVHDERAVLYAYGKLADSSEWRFAVRMAGVASEYFELDEKYNLRFAENGNTVIPMTLVSAVGDESDNGKILVFSANRLPEGFVFDRCQSVSIELDSISGIFVPRRAVHRLNEGFCVYVLKGSVVKLRRVEITYEGSDYFLCDPSPDKKGSIAYLGTNELLIVSGKNLFDGRILD